MSSLLTQDDADMGAVKEQLSDLTDSIQKLKVQSKGQHLVAAEPAGGSA